MKQLKLNIFPRKESGSGAAARLRKAGMIPAVIYGESGTRNLQIEAHSFGQLWKKIVGVTVLFELVEEGVEEPVYAVIQDVQRNALSDAFIHIDLHEIVRGKEMSANIPVHAIGEAEGVKTQGGVVELPAHEVGVRCRPRNLPEFIEVDVSALKINDSIRVKELPAIEGVEYTSDPELVVCHVAGSGGGASAAAAEEEAEEEAE